MADFFEAFDVVMKHEDDPVHPGKITRNDDGRKAASLEAVPAQFKATAVQLHDGTWYYAYTRTRYGVDERAHPELRAGGFYSTMPADAALYVARGVFHESWKFDGVRSQVVATKIFDASINMGPGNAMPVLQKALRSLNKNVLNWHWGVAMQDAVNACAEHALTNAFCTALVSYYNAVAEKQKLKATPGGWLARAKWGYFDDVESTH